MLSPCLGAVAPLAGTWAWEGGRHRWGQFRDLGVWPVVGEGAGPGPDGADERWRVRTPCLCPRRAVREGGTLESPYGFRGLRGALWGPDLTQTPLSRAQGSRGASGKRVGPVASREAWGSEGRKEQTCAYQGAGSETAGCLCTAVPRPPHAPPPASFLWTQWQGEGARECHVTPRAAPGISAETAAACGAGGQVQAGRALVGTMVGTEPDLGTGTPSLESGGRPRPCS